MNTQKLFGKVYLIGAGTGDPELITIKAVNILKLCNVILVDDLVNPEILNYASIEAKIIHVGKRGGCKSTPQAFINKLLVRYAKQGFTVGRLKGGDPFMFGRGGEELQYLRENNIITEIINGITSGIAVPTSLNIPVTHRDCTHGVVFLTGHYLDTHSWKSLVTLDFTIVIYMGMKNLKEIADQLISNGMDSKMPVAIIQNGTTSKSKAIISPLNQIVADVEFYEMGSPSIIIIGKVVDLADVDAILNRPDIQQNIHKIA